MSLLAWVVKWVGKLKQLMLISTQVEVVVEVGVEHYVAVVEAGADLQYTFPDYRLWTSRSDNNFISALSCRCS